MASNRWCASSLSANQTRQFSSRKLPEHLCASRVEVAAWKVHTTAHRSLPAAESGVRAELDSCMSSDALLMNVFCHAGTLRSEAVAHLLGIASKSRPEFGLRARVPARQRTGRRDRDRHEDRKSTSRGEAHRERFPAGGEEQGPAIPRLPRRVRSEVNCRSRNVTTTPIS